MNTTMEKAIKASKFILLASNSSSPGDHLGRTYDDLFENGDGHEVFIELAKMCRSDEKLLASAQKLNKWINVDYMFDVLSKYEERNPTLF